MGGRGPAPDPIPLKILKGRGNGKDSIGRPIPEPPPFEREIPEAPDWLAPEALEVWERVAPVLDSFDLLKGEDRENFAAYCSAWARFVAATREYQREGITITGDSGSPRIHPAVKIAEVAGRELRSFAQEFGLTPAAEVRIAKPAKPAISEDDKFSSGGAAAV